MKSCLLHIRLLPTSPCPCFPLPLILRAVRFALSMTPIIRWVMSFQSALSSLRTHPTAGRFVGRATCPLARIPGSCAWVARAMPNPAMPPRPAVTSSDPPSSACPILTKQPSLAIPSPCSSISPVSSAKLPSPALRVHDHPCLTPGVHLRYTPFLALSLSG
jgi:hypothetical protein